MMRSALAFILVPGIFLLSGCQSAPPDSSFVAKQWSESIGSLNISPVYPPTEDLQVGDVFIALEGAPLEKGSDYLARAAFLDHVDVTGKLNELYKSRFSFPETADPVQGKIWKQNEAKQDVFKPPATITRLPLVAFPGFTVVKVRSAQLNASYPVQAFQFLFGASYSDDASVTISIPAAETYGIGIYDAAQILTGWCLRSDAEICGGRSLRFFARNFSTFPPDRYQPILYIVSRVYYARSITYKYSSNSVAALRASAAQAAAAALPQANAAAAAAAAAAPSPCPAAGNQVTVNVGSDGKSTVAKDNPPAAAAPKPADDAGAVLDAAQQKLAQSGLVSSMPGVSLSVSSLDGKSIELTQTFAHPVAIGYLAYRSAPIETESGK
jgi:hypothetical protein